MTLTPSEQSWFAARLPICKCGKRMSMQEAGLPNRATYYYICYDCQLRLKLLAAGTDYRKLHTKDKHKIHCD